MWSRVSMMVFVSAISVSTASSAAGTADPAVNFAGSRATFAGNCNGRDAMLSGSDNTVTVRGSCRVFQIAGDGNRVLIDMAPGGTIKVYGRDNRVSWTSNSEPEVTAVGPGNIVTRAR